MSESKIICPHCGAELRVTLAEDTQPAPSPSPEPQPEPSGRMSFMNMLGAFNEVLASRGYNTVGITSDTFDYLSWAFNFADNLY